MSKSRFRALHWRSQKAAEQRYEEIVSKICFEGKSVLDVGCGFGDITAFIIKKTKNFTYTGIDRIPEFVEEARKLHPKYEFMVGDYFAKPSKERYDIVIACGSLNSNVPGNLRFRKRAIKTMFEHAQEIVFFNMAGKFPQPKTSKKSNVWFADPLEILRFSLSLTPKVTFINHPTRREFSIILFR